MKTVLIDGKNTLYRHNFTSNLTDKEGNKISGTFGMFKDIMAICKNLNPDQIIVAWDKGQCQKRLALYPEYKSDRHKNDDDPEQIKIKENLGYQLKQMKSIIKFLPIKQISLQDVEADDIIGYLCKRLKGDKIIYSNDTDFIQCISENTDLLLASKKKMLTIANVDEHLGFSRKNYTLWKSLCGDSSDSIKGVRGIGNKTATKIILKQKPMPEDTETIKRNLKLIKIGFLLSDDEKQAIVNLYKAEGEKKPNSMGVRGVFLNLNFKSYLLNFQSTINTFRKLNQNYH